MKKRSGRKSGLFIRGVVLVFAVFSIFSLARLQSDISEKKEQLALLRPQIEELEKNIAELEELLENGSQESIIERAAREKLGYVYADEQIYTNLAP